MYLVCRLLRPHDSILFPYTTLFRSGERLGVGQNLDVLDDVLAELKVGVRGVNAAVVDDDGEVAPAGDGQAAVGVGERAVGSRALDAGQDRKSTRLNSSHRCISYAVFCAHTILYSFPTRRSSDLESVSVSVRIWTFWMTFLPN